MPGILQPGPHCEGAGRSAPVVGPVELPWRTRRIPSPLPPCLNTALAPSLESPRLSPNAEPVPEEQIDFYEGTSNEIM